MKPIAIEEHFLTGDIRAAWTGEPSEVADQVTPVLRQALGFMGIHDVDVVRAGGSLAVNLGKVRLEDHPANYESAIARAARSPR